jgi:hypothetical protein
MLSAQRERPEPQESHRTRKGFEARSFYGYEKGTALGYCASAVKHKDIRFHISRNYACGLRNQSASYEHPARVVFQNTI